MKNLRLAEQKGIAQIFLLIGMFLIAISLPIATKLVQNRQDGRSSAFPSCSSYNGKWVSGVCKESSYAGCIGNNTCEADGYPGESEYNCKNFCKSSVTIGNKANWTTCNGGSECKSGICGNKTKTCSDGIVAVKKCETATLSIYAVGYDSKGNKIKDDFCAFDCQNGYCVGANNGVADSRCAGKSKVSFCSGTSLLGCDGTGRLLSESKDDPSCKSTTAICSTSSCGSCGTASTCGAISGCVWSYSGNYCEKKTSCTSGGKNIANGDHTCQTTGSNSVEYVCNTGSLKVVEECTSGCASNGQTCAASKSKKGSCNPTYNGQSFTYDKFPASSNVVCSTGSIRWVDSAANDNTWNWKCLDLNDSGVATSTGADCYANKIVSTTKTQCETNGGKCMTGISGTTSGVGCSLKTKTVNGVEVPDPTSGKTTLSGGCATGYVCCLPAAAKQDGVCVVYASTSAYARIDTTCTSGETAWIDSTGTDGQFEWKCNGLNGGTSSTTCTAKKKVDGVCGTTKLTCNAGNVDDNAVADTTTTYNWACNGLGGGATVSNCTAKKSTGGNPPVPTTALVPSTGIALDPTSVTLAVAETKQITVTLTPANSTDTVTWKSSADSIATVSTNGLITGVAVGTATVTATTTSGKTNTLTVNVTAAATGSAQISFKIAFAGIKPGAACISSLGNLNIEVLNTPTNTSQKDLTPVAVKGDDSEVDSKGNQIFYVRNLALDSKFTTLNTANAVKIKGPFHTRRRMCENNQTSKVAESKVCNISLIGTDTYNFSGYTLLAGDLNRDGVINGMDHSVVKKLLNPAADVQCGREGDLNMDGVVNWLDGNLISDALTSVDDE